VSKKEEKKRKEYKYWLELVAGAKNLPHDGTELASDVFPSLRVLFKFGFHSWLWDANLQTKKKPELGNGLKKWTWSCNHDNKTEQLQVQGKCQSLQVIHKLSFYAT
jgi:hypothetical protein